METVSVSLFATHGQIYNSNFIHTYGHINGIKKMLPNTLIINPKVCLLVFFTLPQVAT